MGSGDLINNGLSGCDRYVISGWQNLQFSLKTNNNGKYLLEKHKTGPGGCQRQWCETFLWIFCHDGSQSCHAGDSNMLFHDKSVNSWQCVPPFELSIFLHLQPSSANHAFPDDFWIVPVTASLLRTDIKHEMVFVNGLFLSSRLCEKHTNNKYTSGCKYLETNTREIYFLMLVTWSLVKCWKWRLMFPSAGRD